MRSTVKTLLAACASTMLIAACSTSTVESAGKTPDVRQGAEVKNVCFSSQIRNWRSLDNRSVIVEKNRNEEFKLDLIGTCQPDDAFTSIGLVSRIGGGSCLERGDQLLTDSRYDGSCSIQRIYEWHKDAGKVAEAPAAS